MSREFLRHHRICPRSIGPDGSLEVAVAEGYAPGGLDALSVAYDRPVVNRVVTEDTLEVLIARATAEDQTAIDIESRGDDPTVGDHTRDLRDLANQAPVVRYVNLLIRDAADVGASDIHVESTPNGLLARFRLDGVLAPASVPPSGFDRAIVSRIKLLADLDIADRRRPQDGRIRVRLVGRELDIRVSVIPTAFGENLVLRLLARGAGKVALEGLGLASQVLAPFARLARQADGMVLVTGPTGSGKTTTLYAALGLRDTKSEKVITLEDPIEYTLEGVSQVPIQAQAGVTFASGLRSILRQDPDVIFVGEMRDRETAELAIQAALTGHAVFSTLHTVDAVGALPRLLDLGIPPYLISATVRGILAQRLVRTICPACRTSYRPDAVTSALLDEIAPTDGGDLARPDVLFRGSGCTECRGTGYRGRTGIFELLPLSDSLRRAIVAEPARDELFRIARDEGMTTLRADGWRQVRDGTTTIDEVIRVTQD